MTQSASSREHGGRDTDDLMRLVIQPGKRMVAAGPPSLWRVTPRHAYTFDKPCQIKPENGKPVVES